MPITDSDIKILKSAVNADTSDGGGAMTGTALVDGASNNLYPDVSQTDRALGRVQIRKAFGVAQSGDSDMLLGSHAVITAPPADNNVAVTIFQTDGWGDTRTEAVKAIEGYYVQGSRMPSVRILDTHYRGSMQLRLYIIGSGSFPSSGDVIVLENPARIGVGDDFRQYVRLQNFEQTSQVMTLVEAGEAKDVLVYIATYALEQALKFDIYGPPITKTFSHDDIQSEGYYAKLYSTGIADTTPFYGIKPLTAPAHVGDYSLLVDGIYTPLVPSNTTEEPVIDAQPTTGTQALVNSGINKMQLVRSQTTYNLRLPSGVKPTSFRLGVERDSTVVRDLLDNGSGEVWMGTTLLAKVDYGTGDITFQPVEYYTVYNGSIGFLARIEYDCTVLVDCDTLTTSMTVTQANQGINYVALLRPFPAQGSLKIEYVAGKKWYELTADMAGRIGGSTSAYGSGGINYTTGSMSVSLGAMPNVGSQIIISFGANTSTVAPDLATLPTKWSTLLDVGFDVYPTGRTLSWVDLDNAPRTATVSSSGVISGDATGQFISQSKLIFIPNHFPNANGILLSYKSYTGAALSTVSGNALDVTSGPIEPGSVMLETFWGESLFITLTDRAGELWGELPNGTQKKLGTIDYATGIYSVDSSFTIPSKEYGFSVNPVDGWDDIGAASVGSTADKQYLLWADNNRTAHYYTAAAAGVIASHAMHPTYWQCKIPAPRSNNGVKSSIIPQSVLFKGADNVYFAGNSEGKLQMLSEPEHGFFGELDVGSIDDDGTVKISKSVMPRLVSYSRDNNISFASCLFTFPSLGAYSGIFRTKNLPLKPGNFQLYSGTLQGSGASNGTLSGDFAGNVDYQYGVVKWRTSNYSQIDPKTIRYNAVALLVLPLNPALLGLDTARLPADGKVSIFRKGDLLLAHNSQQFQLQAPIQKGVVYALGRGNLASVRVADAGGVVLPESLYTVDLAAGELIFTIGADTSAFALPWSVEHTVEDMVLCISTDISGLIKIARPLAHDYSAGTSYVSSILPFGDLFSRAYGDFAQQAMVYPWSNERQGSEILPNYNAELYPILVNNTGAIRERWALIFTSTTAFRCVGEQSGQIGTGVTTTDFAPINPATGLPYFTLRAAGFGSGWSTGNVLRFNSDACGTPFFVLRTVLQGEAQAATDKFRISFRGDVNRV